MPSIPLKHSAPLTPTSDKPEGREVTHRGKPVSSGPTSDPHVATDAGQQPPTDGAPVRQHYKMAGGSSNGT